MSNQVQVLHKPNFFIIGAAKSGTSSLWGYLNEHPEIFMSQKKEPGFFAPEWPGRKVEDRYWQLYANAQDAHKRIGEASTMYLSCPGTAENIAQYVREHDIHNVKLIAMLRNPADRAYSLYNWQVQEGYEYAKNFRKALELEESRESMSFPNSKLTGGFKYNYLYYRSGLYADQIQEYYNYFGKDKVMVIIFEEFIKDIPHYLNEIYDFLELDLRDFQPDIKVYNPSYDVHASWLQFGLRKINRSLIERSPMKWIIKNKTQRDFLLSLGLKSHKPPKLDPELRAELLQKYEENIQRLEGILEQDLSIWRAHRN